jgi:SHS2 domain-containing protein
MRRLKYKILSHTADLRLEVYGRTLEELFANAAEAIGDILSPQAKSAKRKAQSEFRKKIKVKSLNINTLLVDFLNEILAKSHIDKKAYSVQRLALSDNSLEAEIVGRPVDKFDEDIKAVTYHGVDIQQKEGIWQTKLIFDI